ncbi:MAG: hypothetical protein LQ341_001467 [Variospora aurantia]|nr:MAG: hypothetical protein LQ341_001467 [Variospora aurantia]
MSEAVVDIASAVQSASINPHPSPAHDLNPSTSASTKKPVSPATSIPSNAESIPESALKPVPRRANLPPLPDMRFEQSYLASLQGAESWWRIAWITTRDQVHIVDQILGCPSSYPRHAVDATTVWLALLEPRCPFPRCYVREQGPKMVVERKPLEDPRRDAKCCRREGGRGESELCKGGMRCGLYKYHWMAEMTSSSIPRSSAVMIDGYELSDDSKTII